MEQQASFNPNPAPATAPARGLLGTKIPSSVVFVIGILVFLMPFVELRCNNADAKTDMGGFDLNYGGQMAITNTGVGLAFGSEWKIAMNGLGGLLSGKENMNKQQPKQDPNYYAIAALALGIIGLVFCFSKMNGGVWIAMICGILSAVALIGLRFDLDKKIKDPSNVVQKNENSSDWFGAGTDAVKFELHYTPWFYIALLAMIGASVLCYLRMKNSRTA
jgi:hypothetical protein